MLTSPTITAFSGQAAHIVIVTQAAYIQDYTTKVMENDRAQVSLEPKIGVLDTGTILEIRSRVDGEHVEISDLRVQVVEEMGMRVCLAKVMLRGRSRELVWQEPVVFCAELREDCPKSVRMKEGEALVARMRYEVRQTPASARAYASGGHVEETYENRQGSFFGGAMAGEERVLILTARKIDPDALQGETTPKAGG